MSCEYCRGTFRHHFSCPNYEPKGTGIYCSVCEEELVDGDTYVKNDDCDYAHYDCLADMSTRRLIDWCGYSIEQVKDEDYD
jgi:hypothetical protein